MSDLVPDAAALAAALLAAVEAAGPGVGVAPEAVARALGGPHPEGWGPLMQPLRRAALRLARENRLVLLRKGRPVEPDALRGLYRVALPGPG